MPDAGADAVVFLSSSAVESFADANGTSTSAVVACIGPVTADTARTRGLRVGMVAEDHDIDRLAAGLAEVLAPEVER